MLILLGLTLILIYYFQTKNGTLLRVSGGNGRFLISYGKNPKVYTFIGLGLANAVIGIGGAILVNFKNTVDINMSFGLLVSALAAMVIGESIFNAHKMWHSLLGNILGTIIYNLAIGVFLFSWDSQNYSLFVASDVRMITGLLLIIPILIKNKKTDRFNLFNSEW
jgi:putative ABC transport system permease protein